MLTCFLLSTTQPFNKLTFLEPLVGIEPTTY
jgi:hypothetical protein